MNLRRALLPRRVRTFFRALVASGTIMACSNTPDREWPASTERLEQLVRAEIGPPARLQTHPLFVPAAPRPMLLPEASRVVPGLVYVLVMDSLDCSHCPQPSVIIATLGDTARVLRTPSDWAQSASGWSPATRDEAIQACREFVTTTVAHRQGPLFVGERTGPDPQYPEFLYADTVRKLADSGTVARGEELVTVLSDSGAMVFRQHRVRFSAPHAAADGGGNWTVVLWAVQFGGAYRYRCLLPRPRWWGRREARLVIEDSVRWPACTSTRN